MRGLVVLVLISGCYDPSVQAGSPCSANGTCPASLECIDGLCVSPGAGADATRSDTAMSNDMLVDTQMIGWSVPTALSINTTGKESDPSITDDLRELYFVSRRAGGMGTDDIWYASRASPSAAWGTPTNLVELNSTNEETCVEISPDGNRIYFVSRRSGSGDVYTSTRTAGVWAAPSIVTELSTADVEDGIAVSPDGLVAMIDRGSLGNRTMYIAERANVSAPFDPPIAIAEINGAAMDPSSPSLTNAASVVYFHADTTRNVYVVTRSSSSWSSPAPITEVNTTSREAAPFVTQANDYMLFERENDLYETQR